MNHINHILGCNVTNLEQGTPEWFLSRAGVITASKAYQACMDDKLSSFPDDLEIVSPKRGVNIVNWDGKEFTGTKADCVDWVRAQLPKVMPDTKADYLNELIAEVVTGQLHPESGGFKAAEWGKEHESKARDSVEARKQTIVTEAGLIYKDDTLRTGASVDGLLEDEKETLEIKCPFRSAIHVATLLNKKIKPEYIYQYQFQLWVTGYKVANFGTFDPRMRGKPENRLCLYELERDQEMMDIFDEKIPAFIKLMDDALEQMGFEFGDQWRQAA